MSGMLPVAVDAMGGDRAPDEIVAGAVAAAAELGVPVALVGPPGVEDGTGLALIEASEVIGMDDDPARAIRTKKDATLLRAAEAVRDGRASAMVSAGNTGATMAAALFRMGRIKGVARPCIATPLPVPGSTPTVLVDAGANAECQPEWLVQFAQMASVLAQRRFDIASPRVGLLSIGEEDTKGTPLVKETHALLRETPGVHFIGNVEGRDLLSTAVDVVVTDGFTGNVALKTLEGAMTSLIGWILEAFATDDQTQAAADVLMPSLMPLYSALDPDTTGGAMLLGVDGVCVISHGSSSARAIVNAVKVGAESAQADLVGEIRSSIRS